MNIEHVIAICTTVIAMSSMAVAIWQGSLSRRHNKLSVKPYISILWDSTPGNNVKVYMKNYGVGPAFIRSVRFKSGDKEFCSSSAKELKSFFDHIGLETTIPHILQFFDCFSAMSPSEETSVLEFTDSNNSSEKRLKVISKLRGVELLVEYSSTYEEVFISQRVMFATKA
ncbi:hypothetical protein O1C66_003569 [Vibrio cholerae]|nr:hypothetical protein [Vibrio cholerae]